MWLRALPIVAAFLAGDAAASTDAPAARSPQAVPLEAVARVHAITDAVEVVLDRGGGPLDRTGATALENTIRAASRHGIEARLRDHFGGLVLEGLDARSVERVAEGAVRRGFRRICRRLVLSAAALDHATATALASGLGALRAVAARGGATTSGVEVAALDAQAETAPCGGPPGSAVAIRLSATGTASPH